MSSMHPKTILSGNSFFFFKSLSPFYNMQTETLSNLPRVTEQKVVKCARDSCERARQKTSCSGMTSRSASCWSTLPRTLPPPPRRPLTIFHSGIYLLETLGFLPEDLGGGGRSLMVAFISHFSLRIYAHDYLLA